MLTERLLDVERHGRRLWTPQESTTMYGMNALITNPAQIIQSRDFVTDTATRALAEPDVSKPLKRMDPNGKPIQKPTDRPDALIATRAGGVFDESFTYLAIADRADWSLRDTLELVGPRRPHIGNSRRWRRNAYWVFTVFGTAPALVAFMGKNMNIAIAVVVSSTIVAFMSEHLKRVFVEMNDTLEDVKNAAAYVCAVVVGAAAFSALYYQLPFFVAWWKGPRRSRNRYVFRQLVKGLQSKYPYTSTFDDEYDSDTDAHGAFAHFVLKESARDHVRGVKEYRAYVRDHGGHMGMQSHGVALPGAGLPASKTGDPSDPEAEPNPNVWYGIVTTRTPREYYEELVAEVQQEENQPKCRPRCCCGRKPVQQKSFEIFAEPYQPWR